MDITERLYVEIHPLTAGQIPHPHPVDEAGFDTAHVYKVLGMYNPSETSECFMVLANTKSQIWFIPQRHLRAYALLDSDEFFLTFDQVTEMRREGGRRRDNRLPRYFAAEGWADSMNRAPGRDFTDGQSSPATKSR